MISLSNSGSHSRQMASSRLIDPRVWCRTEHFETLSGGRRLETWRMAISCGAFCLADWNNDLAVSTFFRIISVPRNVPHIAYWCSRIGVKDVAHGSPVMPRIKPRGLAAFDCTSWDICNNFHVHRNMQNQWLGWILKLWGFFLDFPALGPFQGGRRLCY